MVLKYFFLSFVLSCSLFSSHVQAIEYRIGLPVEVGEIDPFDLSLIEEWEVYASVHDTLLTQQVLKGFEPLLAERWEFNKEKRTITFTLKQGLKFSDGSDLTGDDVDFTLRRLIALDSEENLTLTKCLQLKGRKYRNLAKSHPLIRVENGNQIILGPTDCGESILKEIGDANYGIIPRKAITPNLKLAPGAPVSGAFIYKKTSDGFMLISNKHNWRWLNAKNKDIQLRFLKVGQEPSSIQFENLNAVRTANSDAVKAATLSGFQSVVSLPIMAWFLSVDEDQIKAAKPLLAYLNSNLQKENFSVFKGNQLEEPAKTFFPKEFNCFGSMDLKRQASKISKGLKVQLMGHESGESEIYRQDLKADLQRIGIQVDSSKNQNSKNIKLYLKRQFLGDGPQGSLNFAFRIAKSIPDPERKVIEKLEMLDKESTSSKTRAEDLKQVCNSFEYYHHVPIAHRKYAFLYNDESIKDIFSKGNGNLIYNSLVK